MTASPELQFKPMRAAKVPGDYQVYRAALEWDLTDPIVIESRKDVKSAARWRELVDPFNHQVSNLITFCRRLPVTLLADDVGLGKTISAGLIMSELIARARLSRALIVCPKLLGPQWQDELKAKFDIPSEVVTGRELLSAEPKDVGAVITTYQSARTYLEKLPQDRFEMLILDEAHKLRNLYGTEKAPQVALKFRKALEERRFRFVLMLTATPIQNRLWDLYSLVDLLTVARGHENPFGSIGNFARKFIADDRETARVLKPQAAEEFRSIVYGYMSRVRRGDAKLHFPEREVQLHRVDPTAQELELIRIVGAGIEKMNRLAQISILQALTSSPQALGAQLDNMQRNGTVPAEFAGQVRTAVRAMNTSAKLDGLNALIENLKKENPESWRLVIFTSRRETQTTIQLFLESHGFRVGIINGSSGSRNQDTIAKFRAAPPVHRIIVSTEAGSEGVNLQVANVLVNYDLPWNPMIVEQRIGRVQRLASTHAHVGIFNVTLRGTFEEYIVGRLMEKLQMTSHAIGDIEALLEGSGLGDDDGEGFEEKVRQLVMAALKGHDMQAATQQMVESISEAKATLEREEKRIDDMLGGGEAGGYVGPRAPTLPTQERSLEPKGFALAAFQSFGAKVKPVEAGLHLVEEDGQSEYIRFEAPETARARSTLYAPGSAAFSRLVQRVIASGVHIVEDADADPRGQSEEIARAWVASFGGTVDAVVAQGGRPRFSGKVLVRARATVAHDSYERLVDVPFAQEGSIEGDFLPQNLSPLPRLLEKLASLGVRAADIVDAVQRDEALSEFSRFYIERRAQEMAAAGYDERKRKKIEDDFTPRLSYAVVGVDGRFAREVRALARYRVNGGEAVVSEIVTAPSTQAVIQHPPLVACQISGMTVPDVCVARCAMSGTQALKHYLALSERSGRYAVPEHAVVCEVTGKRLLSDEVERSGITGKSVDRHLLKTSVVSGIRAEADLFAACEFSGVDVLRSELRTSEISGRLYRFDAEERSAVSGKTGHKSEFIVCFETRALLAAGEAEQCGVTGKLVRPSVLQTCEETGTRALPSEVASSSVSGRRALRTLLRPSSVSGLLLLERESVTSAHGKPCAIAEARRCGWGGRLSHPDDLRACDLTGLEIHADFATHQGLPRLKPIVQLLDGVARNADGSEHWPIIVEKAEQAAGKGKWKIEAGIGSPSGEFLAVVAEVRTLLGFRSRHAGLLFSPQSMSIVGRIPMGKREQAGWQAS